MFRALYDWTFRLASHRHAVRSMAAISFAESSVFPIPPDVMLVPMILARREQAYWIATVCTLSSVAGGMLGYAIGYFLYDSVGLWLVNLYSKVNAIGQTPIFRVIEPSEDPTLQQPPAQPADTTTCTQTGSRIVCPVI